MCRQEKKFVEKSCHCCRISARDYDYWYFFGVSLFSDTSSIAVVLSLRIQYESMSPARHEPSRRLPKVSIGIVQAYVCCAATFRDTYYCTVHHANLTSKWLAIRPQC